MKRIYLLSFIMFLFLLVICQSTFATTYYVDKTASGASNANDGLAPTTGGGHGPWLTISQCAAHPIAAGDTCNVLTGGTYNERITIGASGTNDGNRVIYLGGTPRPIIIGVSSSGKNYFTINNFESTNSGTSSDGDRLFNLNSGTGIKILNSYLHDSTTAQCIDTDGMVSFTIQNNTINYCGEANYIPGTATGAHTITTGGGGNNIIKFHVQGGMSQTITLAANTTNAAIAADFHSKASGADIDFGASGVMSIYSTTTGPTSSFMLESVANNPYTTFGWDTTCASTYPCSGVMFGLTAAAIAIEGIAANASDILIDGNAISHVADYITTGGAGSNVSRLAVRNNNLGPSDLNSPEHIDGTQLNSTSGTDAYVMQEGNTWNGNKNIDNHSILAQYPMSHNFIQRFNLQYNGLPGGVDWTRGYFTSTPNTTTPGAFNYNNTYYRPGDFTADFEFFSGQLGINAGPSTHNYSLNNILDDAPSQGTGGSVYGYSGSAAIAHSHDLWFNGTGDPTGSNNVNASPSFVNPGTDFHLNVGSPALNAGGALTTTNGAGSGSTSLTLTNPGFFQDGWGGVTPDCIAIGTVGNTACFIASSINYTTGAATLDTALTWSNGASVWLYKKSDGVVVLTGSSMNIGAFGQGNGDVLSFNTQPTNVNSGSTIASFVVSVLLSGGGTDTGSSASITLTGDTCTVTAGSPVSATAGTATFSSVVVTGYQACILTATASGITSATSNSFNVTDSVAPTPGNSGTITTSNISSSSITVNWTAGTDAVTPQNQLQYEVCRSALAITTIAGCKAATIVLSYATNIVTTTNSGLVASTTYHYNVLIKDLAGNEALYTDVSQVTNASGGVSSGGKAGTNAGFK